MAQYTLISEIKCRNLYDRQNICFLLIYLVSFDETNDAILKGFMFYSRSSSMASESLSGIATSWPLWFGDKLQDNLVKLKSPKLLYKFRCLEIKKILVLGNLT